MKVFDQTWRKDDHCIRIGKQKKTSKTSDPRGERAYLTRRAAWKISLFTDHACCGLARPQSWVCVWTEREGERWICYALKSTRDLEKHVRPIRLRVKGSFPRSSIVCFPKHRLDAAALIDSSQVAFYPSRGKTLLSFIFYTRRRRWEMDKMKGFAVLESISIQGGHRYRVSINGRLFSTDLSISEKKSWPEALSHYKRSPRLFYRMWSRNFGTLL